MRQTKRRLFTGIFALAMVPLLAASAAYACQRLTTAHANPNRAAAGSQVQVQGANYSKEATASNVDIRLDSRNGRVLASIAPAALEGSGTTGKFSVAVTIPADVAIGNHMLVVTQTLSGGQPCIGCPGRANLEVTAASAASSGSDTAAPAASQSQESQQSQQSQTPAQASSSDSSAAAPASEPAASQATTADPSATNSTSASSETAPSAAATTAARPAAVAPAAVAPVAPASSSAAPSSAPATATEAVPAAEAPATAAYESGSASPASPASPVSLLPAGSGERPSPVPGLALAAALGLVLLGLAAFWKSGYVAFGARGGFNTAS